MKKIISGAVTVVLCLRVGYILYDSYQEKQEQIIAAEESEVSDRIADYYEQQALEVFDAIPLGELGTPLYQPENTATEELLTSEEVDVVDSGEGSVIVFGQESAADSEKEQEIEFLSSFSETPTVIPLSESQKLDPSFTEVVEVGKTLPLYTRDHEVEGVVGLLAGWSDEQETIVTQELEQGFYSQELLTVLFDQTQSEDILLLLLQKLQQRFLMDEMLTYMDTYPEKWIGSMQWSDYLFVFANTNDRVAEDANGFQPVYEYAENLFIQQSISSQDRSWYQALTARWKGDTDKMLAMLDDVSDHRYSAMKKDIQTQVEFREQQNDVPVYYRDTLISLVLLQYGYLKPAQRGAWLALQQNPNYILPYQIFAYSHFLQQDRSKANEYMQDLRARDQSQVAIYDFFLGIIAYKQQQYDTAIISLLGVNEGYLLADTIRYLIVSYQALGDDDKVTKYFKELTNHQLTASDYYTYFYEVYFSPFRNGERYQMLYSDPELAVQYHQSCEQELSEQALIICDYGKVGLLLFQQQFAAAKGLLENLLAEYPQSYLYQAMGDYYWQKDQKKSALRYYLQALRTSEGEQERDITQQKIRELVGQEPTSS